MLTHVSIKNFAIIEHWDVDLKNNLTVVTGESGAGKSILINAIELCLGARADANNVRPSADKCEIVLSFDVEKIHAAKDWLTEHDFESDNECVVRRVINKDGRSRTSINGTPCTVQQVKNLASCLMNIHGQHQNQNLLKRSHQLDIIDSFAQHDKLLSKTKTIFSKWSATKNQLASLEKNGDSYEAQRELLSYQVNELAELELQENEYQELDAEHRNLAHAEEYLTSCNKALDKIDNDKGALNQLYTIQRELLSVKSTEKSLSSAADLIENSVIQLKEAQTELQSFTDSFNADPERLHFIEKRLDKIHTLANKHKVEAHELYDQHQKIEQQLFTMDNAKENVIQLREQLTTLSDEFIATATQLSNSRKKSAKKLGQSITEKIQTLGMSGGIFDINFINNTDQTPHNHGLETAEFVVSANPGQALQAMTKVASGGELSRIALAIQVISSQTMTTPTVIFDEVDVGIGGNTAHIVGKILRELGQNAQVLCITHQPQVTVCGHQHLKVLKSTDSKITSTNVEQLSDAERLQEVARMLGGAKITEKTLANATDLLENV